MADNLRVELNSPGIRELLCSSEMMEACAKEARSIQKRAGKGYEISKYTGASRVNVSVYADTDEAASKNKGDQNELLRAVNG